MKLRIWVVPVVVLVMAVAFIAAQSGKVNASAKQVSPGAFWHFITNSDPYTKWSVMPGYMGIHAARSPHGKYFRLYVNGVALKALKKGVPLPTGSILVKENYAADMRTLQAVTPMYKVVDSNPASGDWFWAKYGPEGKVFEAGAPKGCVGCHSTVRAKDWIFTWPR